MAAVHVAHFLCLIAVWSLLQFTEGTGYVFLWYCFSLSFLNILENLIIWHVLSSGKVIWNDIYRCSTNIVFSLFLSLYIFYNFFWLNVNNNCPNWVWRCAGWVPSLTSPEFCYRQLPMCGYFMWVLPVSLGFDRKENG